MREKIYTKRQVLAASLIGGPVAGIYTLSKNVAAVDPANDLLIFVGMSWIPVSLLLLAAPCLPVSASLGLSAAVCAVVYYAAAQRKTESMLIKQARLFEYYRSADVLGTSARVLVATLLTEFYWILAIADYLGEG